MVMKTLTCYTIRYLLSGQWHHSPVKMPLEYADRQYVISQWEPLLETAEEMPFDEKACDRQIAAAENARKFPPVPSIGSSRAPTEGRPKWPAHYPTEDVRAALNDMWQRAASYQPRR